MKSLKLSPSFFEAKFSHWQIASWLLLLSLMFIARDLYIASKTDIPAQIELDLKKAGYSLSSEKKHKVALQSERFVYLSAAINVILVPVTVSAIALLLYLSLLWRGIPNISGKYSQVLLITIVLACPFVCLEVALLFIKNFGQPNTIQSNITYSLSQTLGLTNWLNKHDFIQLISQLNIFIVAYLCTLSVFISCKYNTTPWVLLAVTLFSYSLPSIAML